MLTENIIFLIRPLHLSRRTRYVPSPLSFYKKHEHVFRNNVETFFFPTHRLILEIEGTKSGLSGRSPLIGTLHAAN